MRVALDSNLLVYAELEPDSKKGQLSARIIANAAADGVLPVQVLGEFLRVIQRRMPAAYDDAVRQTTLYRELFITPATTVAILAEAARLSKTNGLQLWDAIICAASEQGGAQVLLSEDMQDGVRLGQVQVVNPFATSNSDVLKKLFAA